MRIWDSTPQLLSPRLFLLEDLKVLKRSPNLLDNVKIGHGQLRLIVKHILFYNIWGCGHLGQVTYNNLMNTSSNSPVISEKKDV